MNNVAPCPILVETLDSVLKNVLIAPTCIYTFRALTSIFGNGATARDPSIGKIIGVLTKTGKNKQTQLNILALPIFRGVVRWPKYIFWTSKIEFQVAYIIF